MERIHKKIISAILPLPFFFAITFCCCTDENAAADETHSNLSATHHPESYNIEKADHSAHQNHSDGDHECTCPQHFSFLSDQSADIFIDLSLHQTLAKNLVVNIRYASIFSLSALTNQSQGPPLQDYFDYSSNPIYLKNANLRI